MTKSIAQDLKSASEIHETTPAELGKSLGIPDTLVRKILSGKLDELAAASDKIRNLSRPPHKDPSHGPVSLLFTPNSFCPASASQGSSVQAPVQSTHCHTVSAALSLAFWEFHGNPDAQALIIDADGQVCFSPLEMNNIKEAARKVYGVLTISSATGRPLAHPDYPDQPSICETHPTYEEALSVAAGLIETGNEVVLTVPGTSKLYREEIVREFSILKPSIS